jgi:anti-sigma factor (TIGR02949 family)
MSLSSTDWLNNLEKPAESSEICIKKKGECLKIIQNILDGEATSDQQQHFEKHILECLPCFEYYNLDKSIKLAIQTKVEKMNVPIDLIETIKLKIHQIA